MAIDGFGKWVTYQSFKCFRFIYKLSSANVWYRYMVGQGEIVTFLHSEDGKLMDHVFAITVGHHYYMKTHTELQRIV